VGASLIHRNSRRYAREADLRFSLVRVNEHLDGISLAGGESDERRRIELHIDKCSGSHASSGDGTHQSHLDHGELRVDYDRRAHTRRGAHLLLRKISFGGLMMAAAAFTQAHPRCAGSWTTSVSSLTGAPRCYASRASAMP